METPAQKLVGLALPDGWEVRSRAAKAGAETGIFYSEGYIVEKAGKKAFLKATDFTKALAEGADPAALLQFFTAAFVYEKDLLCKYRDRGSGKAVAVTCDGKVKVDDSITGTVQYLVFEHDDKDPGSLRELMIDIDYAIILRVLHNITTGLSQLYKHGIARQPITPSNVSIFLQMIARIGGFGTPSAKGVMSLMEQAGIIGDKAYASPELLYGVDSSTWAKGKLGRDAYLLGSMAVFFITGLSMTGLLAKHLEDRHHWTRWGGSYKEVLPHIQKAFGQSIVVLESELSKRPAFKFKAELVRIVRELCNPCPDLRGYPEGFAGVQDQHALNKYIAEFDLMAGQLEKGFFPTTH